MKKEINESFQKVISELSISMYFDEYKEDFGVIQEVLETVIKWKLYYDNNKTLKGIDLYEIKKVHDNLYDLDGKYLSHKGLYLENAYEYLLVIINNIKKENELK